MVNVCLYITNYCNINQIPASLQNGKDLHDSHANAAKAREFNQIKVYKGRRTITVVHKHFYFSCASNIKI
jgi:hypothetical protein